MYIYTYISMLKRSYVWVMMERKDFFIHYIFICIMILILCNETMHLTFTPDSVFQFLFLFLANTQCIYYDKFNAFNLFVLSFPDTQTWALSSIIFSQPGERMLRMNLVILRIGETRYRKYHRSKNFTLKDKSPKWKYFIIFTPNEERICFIYNSIMFDSTDHLVYYISYVGGMTHSPDVGFLTFKSMRL